MASQSIQQNRTLGMTTKLIAAGVLTLAAQAAAILPTTPAADVGLVERLIKDLGIPGLVIALLIWMCRDLHIQNRQLTADMKGVMSASIKSASEATAALREMAGRVHDMSTKVDQLSERVVEFLSFCESKSDPEHRQSGDQWQHGDPDRRKH